MRTYFFDTSAFTRFYALEPGSTRVKAMIQGAFVEPPTNQILVSEFIHPETSSALLRIGTAPTAAKRGLSKVALRSAFAMLDEHMGPRSTFTILGLAGLMPDAAEMVRKHGLRASDAVHLATARFARRALQPWGDLYFVCCDEALNAAAQAEGFEVIDPTV